MFQDSSQDFLLTAKNRRGPSARPLIYDEDLRTAQTIPDALTKHRASTGLDLSLFILFVNGGVAVCWAAAQIVFSTGVVPIYWGMSQYGQRHQGITNVIITIVATASTAHLRYTVKTSARQYTLTALHDGVALEKWKWLQGFAEGTLWPPLK